MDSLTSVSNHNTSIIPVGEGATLKNKKSSKISVTINDLPSDILENICSYLNINNKSTSDYLKDLENSRIIIGLSWVSKTFKITLSPNLSVLKKKVEDYRYMINVQIQFNKYHEFLEAKCDLQRALNASFLSMTKNFLR
jgi:septum formation topological specificity factor MinE